MTHGLTDPREYNRFQVVSVDVAAEHAPRARQVRGLYRLQLPRGRCWSPTRARPAISSGCIAGDIVTLDHRTAAHSRSAWCGGSGTDSPVPSGRRARQAMPVCTVTVPSPRRR